MVQAGGMTFKERHLISRVYCTMRQLAIAFPCLLLTVSICQSQSKPTKSPLCSRENAVEMLQQQIDVSKTFDDSPRRISVLIRTAELLWPYQQDKARTIFNEAFELASENEKANREKDEQFIIRRMQMTDQRFAVIRAVTAKDPAWAKELTRQLLKQSEDGEVSTTRSSFEKLLTGTRLLDSAHKLVATDINAALDLARASLNYPASFMITRFLYRLSEVNQQAADQFYAQALAVYADRPMREFLYLQAYPFAWTETMNTPVFAFHEVPAKFVTNPSLQRQFMQIFLRRAREALEIPLDEGDTYRNPDGLVMSGKVNLLQGLVKLEPQISSSLPDLSPAVAQARENLLVTLPADTQKLLLQPGREITTPPEQTFDEQVNAALKVSDVNERDSRIANAVSSGAANKETLAAVIQAIEKISESDIRAHFLELLYFQRAGDAVKEKRFAEAEKLTSKVEGPAQRAYLKVEIAKALLNRSDSHAQEVLDDAITEAKKAGPTIFAARVLLTASSLYAKIDLNQSISVLADAIECINNIESPDFFADDQSLIKTLTRKGRGGRYAGSYFARFYMPGLDPESAFREIAKLDFDTALSQSSGLTDKFQRAMSTLGLADVCLQQVQQEQKQRVKKKSR